MKQVMEVVYKWVEEKEKKRKALFVICYIFIFIFYFIYPTGGRGAKPDPCPYASLSRESLYFPPQKNLLTRVSAY